ncbi:MAG TPA: MFS transporter [Castellaniella sp.]|uniref:MFS transporter n=1 Tax=Castellaniella sp. TaxID=1955812 RepID=UPI002F11C47B
MALTLAVDEAGTVNDAGGASVAWTMRGGFTIAFLGIGAGLQLGDMGLQAVVLSAIQKSFGVGDAALGALQGLAGVLIGSALAIPLARYADRFSRKRVLLCLIAASSLMMALSAFAPNFPLFFLGRSAAGITEFAMVPLVYSMIPDLASERYRVAANLSFAALMAAGASSGFYFSGAILSAANLLFAWGTEAWRAGFLLLALAGIPLLALGAFTADPVRHVGAATANADTSLGPFLAHHWRTISLFAGAAGFLLTSVQATSQLITLALERQFHAGASEIGPAMGIIVLISSVGCLPVAGLLDHWLTPRVGRAARPLIMAVAVLASIPVLLSLLSVRALNQAFVVAGIFLFTTCTANALVPTLLQDLTTTRVRARCFALWSFVVSLFSASGPLVAGMVSDWLLDGHLLKAITTVAASGLVISALCATGSCALALRTRGHIDRQ